MNRDDIIAQAEDFGSWYHEIELVPGYITKSNMTGIRHYWKSTHKVIDQVDYKGKTVLDLGTMDGYWAFEAEKRGASYIVTSDIWQGIAELGMKRFLLARAALSSKVMVVPNTDVHDLVKRLGSIVPVGGFDIIQNFGMLYHIQNPMLALHQIRRCLSDSGQMILETACWNGGEKAPVMRFNSDQVVYKDGSTYWLPNHACLFAMLRMTGFEPNEANASIVNEPVYQSNRITILARAKSLGRGVDAWGMY